MSTNRTTALGAATSHPAETERKFAGDLLKSLEACTVGLMLFVMFAAMPIPIFLIARSFYLEASRLNVYELLHLLSR